MIAIGQSPYVNVIHIQVFHSRHALLFYVIPRYYWSTSGVKGNSFDEYRLQVHFDIFNLGLPTI